MFKKKKKPTEPKPIERFEFVTPKEALLKVAEIGAENIKFEIKPFKGMKIGEKNKNKYLIVKENGIWYLRLC